MGDWAYVDNYDKHENGRIWPLWDSRRIEFKFKVSSAQLIHGGLFKLDGTFICWLTVVYAFHQLNLRRSLWEEMYQISQSCGGEWPISGDFNNVLTVDRVGGAPVHLSEYVDVQNMMGRVGLFDFQTVGEYYPWSNSY